MDSSNFFCINIYLNVIAYRAGLGYEDLDSARQSQIEASKARVLQEEHHSPIGKGDDKDRFGKVAASQNHHNLTACGISQIEKKKDAEANREVLKAFFTAIKVHSDRLRFVLITGVTK